jgi:hypothetical protein
MAPLPSVKLSRSMTLKNNIELSLHNRICGVMVSVTLIWNCIVLAHWSNSPRIDMSFHSDTLSWFRTIPVSLLFLFYAACLLCGEVLLLHKARSKNTKASTQHKRERAKTLVLFGIRIMCPSGTTCLSADCCFNELALCNSVIVA